MAKIVKHITSLINLRLIRFVWGLYFRLGYYVILHPKYVKLSVRIAPKLNIQSMHQTFFARRYYKKMLAPAFSVVIAIDEKVIVLYVRFVRSA